MCTHGFGFKKLCPSWFMASVYLAEIKISQIGNQFSTSWRIFLLFDLNKEELVLALDSQFWPT